MIPFVRRVFTKQEGVCGRDRIEKGVMPMNKKRIASAAILSLCLGIAVASIGAYSYYQESKGLIEVCDNGIAYVPKGTRFVKCHGVVRSVVLFERGAVEAEDCACIDYKCCDGFCYVFIVTDPEGGDSAFPAGPDAGRSEKQASDPAVIKMWISC